MSADKGFLLQSLYTLIARFTGVGLNFALSILIARMLTLANYGDMRMLLTLITGIALFSRIGVEQLVIKEIASVSEQQKAYGTQFLKHAYTVIFTTSLIAILLWISLSDFLTQLLFDKISTHYFMLAALGIIFYNLLFINSVFLKAIRKTVYASLVENSLPAISFLLLIFIFQQDFPINQLHFKLYTASLIMAGLLSVLVILPWLDNKTALRADIPNVVNVVKSSLPLAPISYLAFMMLWSDTLMVGALLSSDKVALYTTAAQISFLSLVVLNALESTIYPRLLSIDKNQEEELRHFFWKASFLVIVFLLGVTLVVSFIAQPILSVFGPAFKQATAALIILLFAQWVRALSLTFSFMFIIRDKVKHLNMTLAAALIVNIIANYFMITSYGYIGAAYATLFANAFLTSVVVLLFYHHKLLANKQLKF